MTAPQANPDDAAAATTIDEQGEVPGSGGGRGRGRPRDPEVDRLIVDAAVDLICEHGFDGLTMEAVARDAGIAKATLYRRFPCKVDLAVAACHAVSPSIAVLPDTGSLAGDLVEVVAGVIDKMASSDGGRLMPAMVAASGSNPDVREALRRFSSTRRSRLRDVLARAVAAGDIRPDVDVDLVADCLVGPIAFRHLVTGQALDRGTAERLVDQVLRGIET